MQASGNDNQIIWLQAEAPAKPHIGQACNGCGVCCAAEPCPVARVFLRQMRGTCRALEWHADVSQYRCGMLLRPAHYLFLLPRFLETRFRSLIRRWIAAGVACDSDAYID
ncbi:hypothetical protein [Undibacterium sp. Di24W]|uniref:hypothetical protein n=1 Tax=Undibacterium sp. Di24W TaxID=3413033 RepID=UPI003BF0D178